MNGFSLAEATRQALAEHGWPADPQSLDVIARKVAIGIPPEHRAAAWIEVLAAYARDMRREYADARPRERSFERFPGTPGRSRSAKVDRIRESLAPYLAGTHPAVPGKALGEYGPADLIAVAVHSEGVAASYGLAAGLCRDFAAKMTGAGVQRVRDMPEAESRAAFDGNLALTP